MAASDNILIKLREIKQSLTPAEKKVAEYILAYPEEVPRYSVNRLALRSKTSDSSVVRLCKSLGFEGYRQLIVSISSALAARAPDSTEEYTDIRPGDDLKTIIRNISLNNCKSIEDTLLVIDDDAVSKAVNLLVEAKKIVFYGIGASSLVCMDAQMKFIRINKVCQAFTEGHAQLTSASLLTEQDVALIVSNTGATSEIIETLKVIKETGAAVIAITRYGKSILSANADIVLFFTTPELTIRSGAMGSRIAMLNIIDILFAGVASKEYKNIKKYLDKTHNVLIEKQLKFK